MAIKPAIGLRHRLLGSTLAMLAVLVPVASDSASAKAPLALGAYIPDASEDPGAIDRFSQEVGRRPVIVLSYKDWGSLPFDRAELNSIWRRGAVPMITWEPWTPSGRGFPLRQIASGKYDRYLRRAAGSARLWGRPFFVRFAHEMNADWFPWGHGVGGNTARDFRKAWKHVVDLFRGNGAANVIWVWSPNEDSGGSLSLAPFYPGDAWVDWVALDGFNFGGAVGWPSFTAIFGSSYERLAAITDRPMMITETGANEEGGDKAAWILSALGWEAPRFPRLRALVWFDDRVPDADLRIDSSPASLQAFRRVASSPALAGTRDALLATPDFPVGGALAPAEPEGDYGAPSLLERVRIELEDRHLWPAGAIVIPVLPVFALLLILLSIRSRRAKAAG